MRFQPGYPRVAQSLPAASPRRLPVGARSRRLDLRIVRGIVLPIQKPVARRDVDREAQAYLEEESLILEESTETLFEAAHRIERASSDKHVHPASRAAAQRLDRQRPLRRRKGVGRPARPSEPGCPPWLRGIPAVLSRASRREPSPLPDCYRADRLVRLACSPARRHLHRETR